MSRSGYTDDCDDQWAMIRWRGAVTSAFRGRRGQAFVRELLAALEAMPVKELIENTFRSEQGFCTLGVIGAARGIDMPEIKDEDDWDWHDMRETATHLLKIPDALAAEIMYMNDEGGWYSETPAERWKRMHAWLTKILQGERP